MSQSHKSLLPLAHHDQRGQVLPIVAFLMVILLGFAGLVIDVGHAYFSYHELQASTDAAVLAAAQGMPYFATANTNATGYSGVSGNRNAFSNLKNVSIVSGYPKFECLTTLTNEGLYCVSDASGTTTATANAVQVKQTVNVPTYFMKLFGFSQIPLTATATASMRGAATAPYNVAIVLDTTASMDTTDTNCSNKSRLACATAGVQVLLQSLSPCTAAGCGSLSSGNYHNSFDRVSLFTFPGMTTDTASADYDCNSTNPTIYPYTFPGVGASSTGGVAPTMPYYVTTGTGRSAKTTTYQMTYQVLPFMSDYRSSNTAGSLSTTSNLTRSVGGKSGCAGMGDPGGEGTYYAGAIYAAQSALASEQAANTNSQNVMILVSDGQATASSSEMATSTTSTTGASSNGTYPSYKKECQQAVTAAQYATGQGTRVYAVAYGAASSGCTTDTGNYASPCYTMAHIASLPSYFYSDYNQSGSDKNCKASQPISSLNDIFSAIAGDLTVARLIPDNTT